MINQNQEQLNSQLLRACEKGNDDIGDISMLLERGANIHAQTKDGEMPLHLAVMNGPIAAVKLLLERGASVNAPDNDNCIALYEAANRNSIECIKLLLEHGAEINTQARDGWTALFVAALKGHIESVRMLLENGADINIWTDYNHTTLSWVKREAYATWGDNYNTIKLLVETAQFADAIYNQVLVDTLPSHLEVIDQDLVVARIKNAILTNQPDLDQSISIIKAIEAIIPEEAYQEIIIECIKIHPEINSELIGRNLDQNPELVATAETMSGLPLLSDESFAVINQFQEETKDNSSWGALIEELDLDTEQFIIPGQFTIPEIDPGQGESKTELIGDDSAFSEEV